MTYRLAIVASHVIQYQGPFFTRLAAEPDVDLTVIYCSRAGLDVYRDKDMNTSLRWDIDLLEGYRSIFLRNFGFGDGLARLINPEIVPAIVRGRYDAVILMLGWGAITSLLAIAACRGSGTPFYIFGDSAFPPPERSLASKLRAKSLRAMFALAEGFMVSGVLNGDYYRHYGADPKRFFPLPWAIDNARFEAASRFAPGERDTMRARFDIAPDRMAIVFSAKLIPRKDPMTLLRAVDRMRNRDKVVIVILGDGELRDEMQVFARERNIQVRFAGFVNQTELPKHYAMCDVFVLPTRYDPRGTVTNEAMACGLPIVITDRCGVIGDIVQHGDNGFVFSAGDIETLSRNLDTLVDDPALRVRMARRSRDIIGAWNYESGVLGVTEALRTLSR